MESISTQDLLETLPGVNYIVDVNGRLVDAGRGAWRRFAIANKAPELSEFETFVGQSIFNYMNTDELRTHYRQILQSLMKGSPRQISFNYRCDSPETRREMRMEIRPIFHNGELQGFFHHSVVLSESSRAPIDFLEAQHPSDPKDPILGICAYCLNVRFPAGSQKGEWVSAEEYYRRGGISKVSLSHGICPACASAVLKQIH